MIPALKPHLDIKDFWTFLSMLSRHNCSFPAMACETFKANHCLTFTSGRASIYYILKANNIRNKYVVVSAYTCCVVTEAIVKSGNIPYLVDPRDGSFNADLTHIDETIALSEVGAIIITPLFGIPDSNALAIQQPMNRPIIILDNSLSPNLAAQRNRKIYDYVLISCGVRKPMTCLGGAIVLTDGEVPFNMLHRYMRTHRRRPPLCKKIARFLFTLLLFGAFSPGIYQLVSYIRRNTKWLDRHFNEKDRDVQCASEEYDEDMHEFQKRIGVNQLKKFGKLMDRRKEIGNAYFCAFKEDYPFVTQYWKTNTPFSHVPFLHSQRDNLQEYLYTRGIDTERYFDYAIPDLKSYQITGKYRNAQNLARKMINLPIHQSLTHEQINNIVRTIIEYDQTHLNDEIQEELFV